MVRDPRHPHLTGGCQCGAVRYALYAPPERTHFWHCRMCQKAVGNVFAALAPVRRTDFAWTRGDPPAFRSSTIAERHYCAACGTPLTFGYVDSEWIDVTIGSLDRPDLAPAGRHYGIEGRVAWEPLADEWPADTTEDEMTADHRARIVDFQHPDHDTPDDWTPPVST